MRGAPPPVALLHGPEPLLLDDAVARVTRGLFPDGGDLTLSREILDAREAGAEGIVQAALTLPWTRVPPARRRQGNRGARRPGRRPAGRLLPVAESVDRPDAPRCARRSRRPTGSTRPCRARSIARRAGAGERPARGLAPRARRAPTASSSARRPPRSSSSSPVTISPISAARWRRRRSPAAPTTAASASPRCARWWVRPARGTCSI